MVPTLRPDAFVLLDIRTGPPQRGEIVAFRHERVGPTLYVKRVIGLPGDRIAIAGGVVVRNGVRLDEPYVTLRDARGMRDVTVPPDAYFVLGDDRPASEDSRVWGFVRASDLEGRAVASLWPPAAIGLVSTAFALGVPRSAPRTRNAAHG